MKKRYSVDGKIYEIPDNESDSFLADFPHAVEVKHYDVEGKAYEIPLDKAPTFEKDFNIQQPVVTQPDSESKSAKLYNNLLKEGYTVKNLGSQDEFAQAVSDPVKADKIYSGLINDGYTEKNLGSKEDFMSTFVPDKQDPPADPPSIYPAMKKYILNGKIYDESTLGGLAQKSNMSLGDYLKESGATEHNDPNTYLLNGKEYSGDVMAQMAQKSDMPYDDYLKEAGAKKKEVSPEGSSAPNPIDLVNQLNQAKAKTISTLDPLSVTGTSSIESPDPEAQKQADQISETLKSQGYDPDKLTKLFGDIPQDWYNTPGFSKEDLLKGLKENTEGTERDIAAKKYQNQLLGVLGQKQSANPNQDLSPVKDIILNSGKAINYGDKRNDNSYLATLIRGSNLSQDDKDKATANLATDKSFSYGQAAAIPNMFQADPLSKTIDPNQIAAYHYIQDIFPEKADGYKAAFLDPKDIKDNPQAKLGQEEKLTALERIGINLKANAAKEQLAPIQTEYNKYVDLSKQRNLTPDELSKANDLDGQRKKFYDIINQGKDEDNSLMVKYPDAGYYDANQFAQELLGQKHGFLSHVALTAGAATDNTIQGTINMIKSPFLSQKQDYINQMSVLGNEKENQQSTYLTQDNQTSQSFQPQVNDELQAKIDTVKNNKLLPDDEKLQQVTGLLMNNPEKWQRSPIEGGKSNIGLKSLAYGVSDMAANLLPFIATDGILGKTGLGHFKSMLASATATSFQQTYADAIDKGIANPLQYAARVTGINAFALAGADVPGAIRDLAGAQNTAIGDMISKLSDKDILSALRSEPKAISAIRKTFNLGKNVAEGVKGSAIMNAKLTGLTTAGQITNSLIDNKPGDIADQIKQVPLEFLKGTIAFSVPWVFGKFKNSENDITKSVLFDAGKDPDSYLYSLDQKLKDGTVSPADGAQIKSNIENAAQVFKKVPFVDGKGNPLSDKGRRDLMFLKMQENDLENHISKDLPEPLQLKMQERLADSRYEINKIYNGQSNQVIPIGNKEDVSPGIASNNTKLDHIDLNNDQITIGDMLDKTGSYKGAPGTFLQDGQTVVFKVNGGNKEYELGNINEIKNNPISDYDIEHQSSVVNVNDKGNIEIRGTEYQNNFSNPLAAINHDEDGNVNSVNLETSNGQKRTFRGNIAEDIAYQLHLKEINKNNETRNEFERHINEDTRAQKDINDAGFPTTPPENAIENNASVSRTKIKPENVAGNRKSTNDQVETHVTDKRKLLDLLTKENENAEPIIADDKAENDRALEHLTEKDNAEQEPGIKTIESKATSSDKTTLNKVIQDADDLIGKATGVKNIPVSDLATDEASFQNREGINESKVKNIVDNYNPSALDPIQYWTDKDGQKYTLNHHRFEAVKRMGLPEIPARALTYGNGHPKAGEIVPPSDKGEAIRFAKEESNANRSMETPLERANLLREKRNRGDKDLKAFLDKEGRNKTFVENLSYLNPKGKAIETLRKFGDTPDKHSQKETEKIADWIGEARKRNSSLSDVHENEMFDYLKTDNQITNKNEFFDKVNKASFGTGPNEPLNLKKVIDKSDNRLEWEKTKDELTGDVNDLKKLVIPDKATGWTGLKKEYVANLAGRFGGDSEKGLEEFNKPENQAIYADKLADNKALLQSASDKLALHLAKENDLIKGDKSQQSLFNEPAQTYNGKESGQEVPYQSFSSNDYPTSARDIQREENKASNFSTTVVGIWSQTKDLQFSGKTTVKSHADVAHIMRLLENKSVEHAFAVHIDKDGKVFVQFLSVGGRTGTFLDARNVLVGARKHNSVETYLVHNHPSGNLTPSNEDIQITDKIREGLGGLGIKVQHIIMDTFRGEYTLIGRRGDIKKFSRDKSETANTEITAEKFDTFEALTKPLSEAIRDSEDIAKIIHQLRFSALPKRAVLLLNAANEIIANHIIKKHIDAVDLVSTTPTATTVIFYGNELNIDSVLAAQRALLNFDIPVLDYVIRNSAGKDVIEAYQSAAEAGLLNEVQSKYGTNNVGKNNGPLDEKTQLAKNIVAEHIQNGRTDLKEILDTDAKELGLKSGDDLPDSYRKLIEQTFNEEQEVKQAKLNKAEENAAKREIPPSLANAIVEHENLTIENIEAVKQLFRGFPYTQEDYQNIKTYLNDSRQSFTEPTTDRQSPTGNAENKTIGDTGEALPQPDVKDTKTDRESASGNIQPEQAGKENTPAGIEKIDKSFDQKVDEFADKLIKKLSVKNYDNLTMQGPGIKEIVKAGAEIIKAAYHAGSDIKQAIEDAIDYIRNNWDAKFGTFDKGTEKEVRNLLDSMGFNEEGLKSIETERDNKSIERQVKKAMDEGASPKDMADLKSKLAAKYNRTPEEINSIAHAKDIKHVQDLLGDKTDEHLMNMLQRKGFAPHEAIDILGEAKRNVLPPEERERIVTDASKEGNKLIDAWIGDRNVTKKSAEVRADNLHKEIEKTIPKIKLTESKFHFTKRRQIVEAALDFYNETRGMSKSEIAAKMDKVDKVTHAKEWSIYEQSKELTPGQIAVADKMQEWQKQIEQEALKGGVIKEAIENYTTHDWDLSQQKGNVGKFSTSTSHSKERALFTMMDGWAEGLHLKSYGGANKLVKLQQEISGVIQNRNLIEEGLRTKSADGLPVFSIKKLDGYSKIDNPTFKIFKGTPFDVYAPDKVAKGLNNILKRSALYDLPGIETITKVNAGIKTSILATGLFHANTFMRVLYLTTPKLLQLQNPVKVYRDGIKAAREMTPAVIDGLQHGLTLGNMHDGDEFYDSKNKDPQIAAKLSKLKQVINKLSVPQPVKDRLSFEVARQHKWLFGQIMTGLKTNQYIKYREVLAKKFPNLDPGELSRAAAKAINTQYGGNNLELARRNPTLQHMLKLAVLAPDWLESSWGRYAGTLKKGPEGYLYRRMAANTLIRGAALVTLSNMALALMSDDKKKDEPDDWWGRFASRYEQAWKNGNLDWTEIDITPLYHSLGGTKDHAYFSLFGVTTEPAKVLTGIPGSIDTFTGDQKSKEEINYNRGGEGNALTYLSNKFSPTSRFIKESLTSQNWQGMEFTSLPELGGYDNKGEYARSQKAHNKGDISPTTGKPYLTNKKGHSKGDEKGGKLEGKLVTWPNGSAHPLHANQIPSFIGNEIMASTPTQIQNAFLLQQGQSDWFTMIANSIGVGLRVGKNK